jgi:membrane protein required for colicin V production
MELIDLVVLVIVGIGALRGFLRGFIRQLASIAGWIAGFLIAGALHPIVTEILFSYFPDISVDTLRIVSFVVIWLMIPLLFTLIGSIFTRLAEKLSLGGFNRILGLLFGMAKWVLVVGLLINMIDYFDKDNSLIEQTKKEESVLYYPIKNFVGGFLPNVKEVTNEYITI